jgi:hypothetical protein
LPVAIVGFLSFACLGYAADVVGPLAASRHWTDVSGKYKLEAKFVNCNNGKVRLKKNDGSEIDVPFEKLSEADRKLVKEFASNNANRHLVDVSLVTPDHFAAIVINPRRLAASSIVAEQLKKEVISGAIKKYGIEPSEVEQIVVLFGKDEKRFFPGAMAIAPVLITIRFTHDADAKDIATKLDDIGVLGKDAPAPRAPGGAAPRANVHDSKRAVRVGGKTCFNVGPGGVWLAYAFDKNTVVLAPAESLKTNVAATESKGPLFERLRNANADNDLIVVAEIERIPDLR